MKVKTEGNSEKRSSKGKTFLKILAVAGISLFILQGADAVNALGKGKNQNQGNGNGNGYNSAVNHPVLIKGAIQLSEADKKISLVGYGAKGALADNSLSIADMMHYAVQDEYLAHGEYEAIIKRFGAQNPYSNIINSEKEHIAMLKNLFESCGLAFPADDSAGHLVIPSSLADAAKTGVQAEIDNIAMYNKFLSGNLPKPVADVFTFLKSASQNHLEAFKRQVAK